MQQPVGEDMAAFGVGAELDLVDREEIGADLDAASPRRCRPSSAPAAGTIRSSPVTSATTEGPRSATIRS